jgi:predicted acetyltransferase
MDISLSPVKFADRDRLGSLLMRYETELTGQSNDYNYLDSYFKEKNRFPFFIILDGKTVGFVLINSYSITQSDSKSISEFFIESDYRRRGIGKMAAQLVFKLFPGKWEIRQLNSNSVGQAFWRRVITEYTGGNYQETMLDNDKWHGPVQTFVS